MQSMQVLMAFAPLTAKPAIKGKCKTCGSELAHECSVSVADDVLGLTPSRASLAPTTTGPEDSLACSPVFLLATHGRRRGTDRLHHDPGVAVGPARVVLGGVAFALGRVVHR